MDIEIEKPHLKFTEHIQHKLNSRIVLSGKFGTGKSYFLKKFFESKKDDYNIFWISPVNYVVGANQDIFEWIKVDIAKNLIIEYLPSEKEKGFSKNLLIQSYIYYKASSIFSKLIQLISNELIKQNTGISFLDTFKKDIEDYKAFEKNAQSEIKSEADNLNSFLNISFTIKGSIYEDDVTTKIIRASLEILAEKEKKENVLVIDDLDRLDPEHIFRILNILSAHNDHFDSNKFGFNKVVLVCDLENIETLYKHRYGDKADFEGYIEKFFTYEPFLFSIKDAIVSFCQNSLEIFGLTDVTKNTISLLLVCLYKHDKLRIRNLKKITAANINFEGKIPTGKKFKVSGSEPGKILHIKSTFFNSYDFEIDFSRFDFIKGIMLISIAFGGIRKFQEALNVLDAKTLQNEQFDEKYFYDISNSICILSHIAKKITPNPRNIFFIWENHGSSDYFVAHAVSPKVDFFGKQFQLPLTWSTTNVYTGGDYFLDANPLASINSYKEYNKMEDVYNFNNLIIEVKNIVSFLIKEEMI